MYKKLLYLASLSALLLSACGGAQDPPVTAPPVAPSETESLPVQTETVVPEETVPPEPVATEVPPDNAPDCINKAVYVSDVTIPDNSVVNAGTPFTKTWRVQNTGTCIWWSGYTVSHYSDTAMSAPASVPLPRTNPGETADISVDLVAPSVAGTYRGNYVIKNPADLIMQVDNDSRLWLIINVVGVASEEDNSSVACVPAADATRADQVAAAINAYRTQNSLAKFTVNEQLAQAAQAHANDMACNQLFDHDGSDGSTPQTRVAAAGYTAARVTENVYGSYPPLNPDQVVNWWKFDQAEANQNLNMISTQDTEFGVGYAFFNNYGYYVVNYAVP